MSTKKIIIVGAGASGLAAACIAAENGARVLIFEANQVPGRKLLATGSGKCNFSNAAIRPDRYHGCTPAFLKETFKAMPPSEIYAFFSKLGLLYSKDDTGRYFPRSQKAADVVNTLVNFAISKNVEIKTLTEVVSAKTNDGGFEVKFRAAAARWDKKAVPGPVQCTQCDALILASGGPAYPQIGGSASGYELAGNLGHKVTPPRPVIVPLKLKEAYIKQLEGVRAQVSAELFSANRLTAKKEGEVLFTKYGISGPIALELSRTALLALNAGPAYCQLDFFPDYEENYFKIFLTNRRKEMADRYWRDFICGLADEKILLLASELAKIGPNKLVSAITDSVFENFSSLLKNFRVEITGSLGFEDAMVAAGGVDTSEVSPGTFESKKIKNLFLTGELLDIDGDSGGFNLHLAWTSGILAGHSVQSNNKTA